MHDLHNNLKRTVVIAPIDVTDNTAQVGAIIDRANTVGLEFLIMFGVLADAGATFTALVEHGDAANLSDAAAVADSELLGTEAAASATQADDGAIKAIGYIGVKRYVRLTVTPAGNAASAPLCAIAIQNGNRVAPVS